MRDHAGVRAILTHRPPILLVDRVEEIEYFDRIVATKAVSACEPCYAGMAETRDQRRFAYPGSLMIESFGQSGAVLWLESARQDGRALIGDPVVAEASDVLFHRAAYPGDTLRHEARIERIVGNRAYLYGRTLVGGDLAAEYGSLVATVSAAGTAGACTTGRRQSECAAGVGAVRAARGALPCAG
jgi:3-hydroxyacyl-[acyl-carrier-protein] dehydratase